jgi:hypothetical protein
MNMSITLFVPKYIQQNLNQKQHMAVHVIQFWDRVFYVANATNNC